MFANSLFANTASTDTQQTNEQTRTGSGTACSRTHQSSVKSELADGKVFEKMEAQFQRAVNEVNPCTPPKKKPKTVAHVDLCTPPSSNSSTNTHLST